MTTIAWQIESLLCKPTEDGFTNVVVTANWRCNGVFADTYGTVYGSCSFSKPTKIFIPYDDLTQDQVLNWCWNSGVDKNATEMNVEQQIKDQIAPFVVTPPLPW